MVSCLQSSEIEQDFSFSSHSIREGLKSLEMSGQCDLKSYYLMVVQKVRSQQMKFSSYFMKRLWHRGIIGKQRGYLQQLFSTLHKLHIPGFRGTYGCHKLSGAERHGGITVVLTVSPAMLAPCPVVRYSVKGVMGENGASCVKCL